MSLAHVENVDQAAVLRTLNLNPSDPNTQALLLICDRYRLDPLLKHVVLIQGRPYITRDGYLSVAHASGQFDGIEIVEEGEDQTHWWARASVFRKDMTRPFTYRGRHPKSGSNKQYGPEMAVKCAEVMALRRAFNVTGVGAADERWDADTHERIDPATAADIAERLNVIGPDARRAFLAHFGGRRPQQLSVDDELAAEAFTAELEAQAEAPADADADVIDVEPAAGEEVESSSRDSPPDPQPAGQGHGVRQKAEERVGQAAGEGP